MRLLLVLVVLVAVLLQWHAVLTHAQSDAEGTGDGDDDEEEWVIVDEDGDTAFFDDHVHLSGVAEEDEALFAMGLDELDELAAVDGHGSEVEGMTPQQFLGASEAARAMLAHSPTTKAAAAVVTALGRQLGTPDLEQQLIELAFEARELARLSHEGDEGDSNGASEGVHQDLLVPTGSDEAAAAQLVLQQLGHDELAYVLTMLLQEAQGGENGAKFMVYKANDDKEGGEAETEGVQPSQPQSDGAASASSSSSTATTSTTTNAQTEPATTTSTAPTTPTSTQAPPPPPPSPEVTAAQPPATATAPAAASFDQETWNARLLAAMPDKPGEVLQLLEEGAAAGVDEAVLQLVEWMWFAPDEKLGLIQDVPGWNDQRAAAVVHTLHELAGPASHKTRGGNADAAALLGMAYLAGFKLPSLTSPDAPRVAALGAPQPQHPSIPQPTQANLKAFGEAEALMLLRRAARAGHVLVRRCGSKQCVCGGYPNLVLCVCVRTQARLSLAFRYTYGLGVKKDCKNAAHHYVGSFHAVD